MRLISFVVACVLPLLIGCPGEKDVPCSEDSDCDLTTGGKCTLADSGNKWCAYPDPNCSSGLRFSDQGVGDSVGDTCTSGTQIARYTLTVTMGGSGMGGVTTAPTGLACTGNTCTGQFDDGTVVQISALATSGQFLGWSNACNGQGMCSVTMSNDQTVGALFGTPGQALWAKQLGSPGRDYGHGIAVDANDDVIAVGEFSNTLMAGSTALASGGGTDIYVVKVAAATGNVIWAKRLGGTMDDVAFGVAVDSANDVYVAGRFLGSVDFGGGALQGGSGYNAFALKLGSDGAFGWARKISGASGSVANGIATRGSAVVVVGVYTGSMTIDATPLTSAGSSDIFAMSMASATGTTNWIKSFGGTSGDVATDVAIDSADNVVLTGYYAGTVNFGGGALSTPGNFSDVLLLKLAGPTGAHLLSQHYGSSTHDYGYAVTVDTSNNIYLAGDFGNTADFTCASSLTASQANLSDAFLVKFTQAGSCAWAKGFGGSGLFDRNARGVTVNAVGDVALTGSFCGTLSLGGATLTAAGTCGNQDLFAARFSTTGTHLNSVRAGGVGSELGMGVAQSADGRFFVTGGFQGLAEFGGTAFTSAGSDDAYILGLEAL